MEHFCGNKETQEGIAKVLASLQSRQEVIALCKPSKMSIVGIQMANHYLDQIGKTVGPNYILEIYDWNSIIHVGYGSCLDVERDYKPCLGGIKGLEKVHMGSLPLSNTHFLYYLIGHLGPC